MIRALAALACVLALGGCGTTRDQTLAQAQGKGMRPAVVDGGPFDLYTLAPTVWRPGAPLSVYIEGDGHAWVTRDRPSSDPTPRNPVALQLAIADPAANVAYIARPCQYVTGQDRRNCHPVYWSVARTADEVVVAVNTAVDRYKAAAGAGKVMLYGYSGGGAVALLVAARRTDVARVVTVAGLLDTEAWTRAKGTTPLDHSLNPADFTPALAAIPQIHFSGSDDTVIPTALALDYARRFGGEAPPRVVSVPGVGHECCWAERWPALLSQVQPTP